MTIASDIPAADTTEARIWGAAAKLFYDKGYHATTMRDIASEVGIKAGSLYNHFPGKQDILLRISLQTTRELHEGAVSRLEGITDVEEAIRAFLQWHVVFHAKYKLASGVWPTGSCPRSATRTAWPSSSCATLTSSCSAICCDGAPRSSVGRWPTSASSHSGS